ncbi:hypothetical protein GCM10012275_62090 [Longimycelium tulufanense]|uniref:Helix-turn-helix domain-containing protein n=1 Tax=Longimycelium tulufanense TaxID=907463 RepID=A0A8J3FX40_9PSEU|nr:hypothetical protein [Longimycelium tulufanense]GGM83079.1 hypothetical protein GCM10012275_62090 [Longimycelium tulufanense]
MIRDPLADDRLSHRAVGLLLRLVRRHQHHPGAPIDSRSLARPERREGRDAIQTVLRELREAGYLVTARTQDPVTGRWSTTTVLAPDLLTDHEECPRPDNPAPADNPQVAPGPGYPAPVGPEQDFPASAADELPQVSPKPESPSSVVPEPDNPAPAAEEFPQASPKPDNPAPSTCGGPSARKRIQVSSGRGARARAHARPTAAELAATAVRADAVRLVATWRDETAAPYRPETLHALQREADALLREGADPRLVRAALEAWDARADARTPKFLRYAYDDVVKAHRAITAGYGPNPAPQAPSGRYADAMTFLRQGIDLMRQRTDQDTHSEAWPPLSVIDGGIA